MAFEFEHLLQLGIASEKRKNLPTQAIVDVLFAEYERDGLPSAGARLAEDPGPARLWGTGASTCFERALGVDTASSTRSAQHL